MDSTSSKHIRSQIQYQNSQSISHYKMASSSNLAQLPPSYKHQTDTRSSMEKLLTDKIARAQSELNINRINSTHMSQYDKQINDKFCFICVQGVPPVQGQFDKIDLPGPKVVITLIGFDKDYSESEQINMFKKRSWDQQVNNLRKHIERVCNERKEKIILVFHSFGTYVVCVYFKKFKDHKIDGIIQLGGAPLRFYPIRINTVNFCRNLHEEFLLQNANELEKNYVKALSNGPTILVKNKYQIISIMKLHSLPQFEDMFENMRHFPKILKFIAYGRQDAVFTEERLNQKFIYYSYVDELEETYHKKAIQAYYDLYKKKVDNVQERFCFNFKQGKHSIHMQNKICTDLRVAIRQYLWIISKISQ